MSLHEFTLILDLDLPPSSDEEFLEFADRIMAAVDGDAPLAIRSGVHYLEVVRTGGTLSTAIEATIGEVESVTGVHVVHVDGDLVTAAEIGERIGKTRQAVQMMVSGQRGPGHFPAPLVGASSQTRLWRWVDVLKWLGGDWAAQIPEAIEILRANHRLDLRSMGEVAKSA